MAVEMANFAGLSQAETPVIVRRSFAMPTIEARNAALIRIAVAVRGLFKVLM
jgi:hypothetical protein